MTEKSIEVLNKEVFPLFKVVFEESFRFRDVDSEIWLDSEEHELIRRGHKSVLYVKEKYGDDWVVVYDRLSNDLIEAHIQIEKIKQSYSYWKSVFVKNEPIMFVYQNQVFKNPYVMFNQLCISGQPIEPEKYYVDDRSIKVDFFKSYVQPISKDEVLLHAEQLYLNGELIFTKEQLKKYKPYGFNKEIKKLVIDNYPDAKTYRSDWESGSIF